VQVLRGIPFKPGRAWIKHLALKEGNEQAWIRNIELPDRMKPQTSAKGRGGFPVTDLLPESCRADSVNDLSMGGV
jgi:hypothetical protein